MANTIYERTWNNFGCIFVLVLLNLTTTVSATQKISWEKSIVTVESSAKKYSDYAYNILGTRWLGAANGSIKYSQHRCAILGRMLGHAEAIQDLERLDYPPLDKSSDPFDLLVFSLTLQNWVEAARHSVKMHNYQRISVWNLECVSKMGISAKLYIDNVQPNADFSLNGKTLLVYGNIEVGFFQRFKAALKANPTAENVSLGSGGGSLRDALQAGYEIRRRGLSTTIHGNCFSACPLVFMGGRERIWWASEHRLGFHQIYTGAGKAIPEESPIYELTRLYLDTMGISSEIVINWMLSAVPNEMFEPNVAELCEPSVATFVQRVC